MRTLACPLLTVLLTTFAMGCPPEEPPGTDDGTGTDGSDTGTTASPDGSSGEPQTTSGEPPATGTTGPGETDETGSSSGSEGSESSESGTEVDMDGDGHPASTDCNDGDDQIYPGAPERCNGIDDDCDPATADEGVVTVDGAGVYGSISDAVAAAGPGSALVVCPGIYTDNVVIDMDLTITSLTNAASTVVDGYGLGPVITIDGGTVDISGLTLTGGASVGLGGGLSIFGTDPVHVESCVITGNSSSDGAGIYTYVGAQLEVVQTEITDNLGEIGGGVAFQGDSLVMTGCTVSGNDGSEIGGGVLLNNGAMATISDTSIVDNTGYEGAGLAVLDSTATVSGCTIERNVATTTGGGARGAGTFQLESVTSGWGTGADDNTPNDVAVGGMAYAYGAGASFVCTAAGCL